MKPFLQLLYVSRSAISTEAGAFEAAVSDILTACARHNPQAGITGALLYDRGRFLQWLEGPTEPVLRRFEIIARDHRHRDIDVVLKAKAPSRRFPQWRMAFTHIGEAAFYRLPNLPLSDEGPDRLTAYLETALADASTLSVAA